MWINFGFQSPLLSVVVSRLTWCLVTASFVFKINDDWAGQVLFPDRIFHTPWKNKSGKLPIPFSFGMLVHCSFLIKCLTSSKIAFHVVCQQSTSEMGIDWATLSAACRLGYCERGTSRSSLFTGVLWIQNPVEVMSQWFQNIGTKMV